MANVYVDSTAAGGGNGTTWALAYQTITLALAGKVAGDDFWIAHTHAETTAAALNIISPGTSALPCRFICVNKAGSVPPVAADLATTATVSTTGANHINFTGIAYCYGIEFKSGDAANNGGVRWNTSGYWKHKLCKFTLNNTSAATLSPANSQLAKTEWEDCTVKFGALSQSMAPTGLFAWYATTSGVSAVDTGGGGIIPTSLFGANCSGVSRLRGLDLSAYSAGNIVSGNIAQGFNIHLENCRHGTTTMGVKVQTVSSILMQDYVFSRVDKTLNYTFEKFSYGGTETAETTVIRTGGATDGTTPVAKKIVTSTNSRIEYPFECIPITVWNETVGSAITLTVQAIWSVGAAGNYPTNANIWIEVEYLSNASYPISSVSSGGLATVLTTPVAYSVAGSGWTGLGGTPTAFAMSRTFTPQMKGPITVRVKATLNGATTTFYVDPKVIIT
jgi:hypothetical protein